MTSPTSAFTPRCSGFYSFDGLEDPIACDIPGVDLRAGDRIRLACATAPTFRGHEVSGPQR